MIKTHSDNTLKILLNSLLIGKFSRFLASFAIVLSMIVHQAGGDSLPHVEVLALFEGKAVLRIDQEQILLSEGEISPQGIRLLEADAYKAVFELDGRQFTYGLGSTVFNSPSEEKQVVAKEIYIYRDPDNLYRTTGSINGFPVNFLVDTGASSIVINAQQANRMGIKYKDNGTPIRVRTASGEENAVAVKFSKVSINGITSRWIDGIVLEGQEPSTPLLGMSYLSRFEIQNTGSVIKLIKKY